MARPLRIEYPGAYYHHERGLTRRRSRQQKVVVVIHQAIGIDLNLPQPGHVGEQVQKGLPSFVLDEDIAAGLARFMT